MRIARALDRWMRWPLVVALGLGWILMSWWQHRSMLVEEYGVDVAVVERYYDRELRLLEAADRAGFYGKWITGADDEDDLLREQRETVRETYLAELGEDGADLIELISLELGDTEDTSHDYSDQSHRAEVRSWLLAGHGDAWDYGLFLNATGDGAVRAFYARQNDRLMLRVSAMSAVFDILTLAGLVCAVVLWRMKSPVDPTIWRFPGKWSVRALLGGFFVVNLLIFPWIAAVGAFYEIWTLFIPGDIAYLLYDLAWRAFPAGVLTLLFLGSAGNAWRVFGMSKPVNWPLLVAVFGATSVADLALFHFAPPSEADPTDFMESADPELMGMLVLLFSSVIVAPVFEETVFRGFLLQGLRGKLGNLSAAAVSTLLFALIHVQYDIWGWLSVAVMGAGAAYLTLRTGSLKTAIVYHATINLLVTANVYYQYQLPL